MQWPIFRRALAIFVIAGALLFLASALRFRQQVESAAMGLESIASVVAAQVDGDAHETLRGPGDAGSAAFDAIRHKLRELQDHYKLRSPIYTLRATRDEQGLPATEFVVMTNAVPFIGERYKRLPEMDPVFDAGARSRTGLYRSESGWWVSGYAPVKAADGRVVALLEVDRPSEDLAAERDSQRLLVLLAAAGLALIGTAASLFRSARAGRAGFVARLVSGSLAVRIGLAGTVSVLAAVAIAGLLDHREARSELIGQLGGQLLSAARIGASLLDPGLHQQVASSGDAASSGFLKLRDQLRLVQSGAGLTSPMYTLRRDGGLVRFVVMTNETPFIGDPYELRPGLRQSFEDGKPGMEGAYTDAHGTWISAWAPILDAQRRPAAFVQADYEAGALLTALANRSLRRLVFAVIGISVAFGLAGLLARSIARPVLELAQASERIAGGDLQAQVAIDRPDEIGALARSFNKMVHNLEAMASALQAYATTAEAGKELELAARLRGRLAPAQPLRAQGAVASGLIEPAEIGGATTYDAFLFGQGAYLVFMMGRAASNGADGLSTLLLCRSALGSLISNFTFRPRDLAAELNRTLAAAGLGMDFQLGVLDIAQGWVTLVNANGQYPYVLRAGGTLGQLDVQSGPRLGQNADAAYTDAELKVEPGDRLIFYSGHVPRLPGATGEEYGLERFETSLQRHAGLAAPELPPALAGDLRAHAGAEALLQDDLALLVIEFQPSGGPAHDG